MPGEMRWCDILDALRSADNYKRPLWDKSLLTPHLYMQVNSVESSKSKEQYQGNQVSAHWKI